MSLPPDHHAADAADHRRAFAPSDRAGCGDTVCGEASVGRRNRTCARREDGFVVIEALVALVILGAGLAMIYQAMASGWGAVRRTGLESRAVAIAAARLEAAGLETPLAEGTFDGVDNGVRWRVVITRQGPPVGLSSVKPRLPAWLVKVDVAWDDPALSASARSFSLTTVKLGSVVP